MQEVRWKPGGPGQWASQHRTNKSFFFLVTFCRQFLGISHKLQIPNIWILGELPTKEISFTINPKIHQVIAYFKNVYHFIFFPYAIRVGSIKMITYPKLRFGIENQILQKR